MQSWDLWEHVGTRSLSHGASAAFVCFQYNYSGFAGTFRKFRFRLDLGSPLITELISAFLKFQPDKASINIHIFWHVSSPCEHQEFYYPCCFCEEEIFHVSQQI